MNTDQAKQLSETAVQGDPQNYLTRLVQFVSSQNIALDYDDAIAPARGMSSGGKITLLPDLSPAEHLATLAHECAHELLHRGERRKETTHGSFETGPKQLRLWLVPSSSSMSTPPPRTMYFCTAATRRSWPNRWP
jgi:hypothetical protein